MTTLAQYDTGQIHLLGIGGAGQNALAEMLLEAGYRVSGSDLKLSATTEALQKRGVTVFEGQQATHLNNVTLVVTTAAAPGDNPELQEAARRGIPVLQNAEMVGLLLNSKRLLAVAGTHGKTTTTGLVAYLLEQAHFDPSYYIGGISQDLGRAGHTGLGEWAVVEADEYARRFWHYQPRAALVTNLEADHLDFYGSLEALEGAFVRFCDNLPTGGTLYLCGDDRGARELMGKVTRGIKIYTYGLEDGNDWTATDLRLNERGGYTFTLNRQGQVLGGVSLSLSGRHNVLNAVGALAMVSESLPDVEPSLWLEITGRYRGAARRFELKGEAGGITVVDDYAHHPTEIRATLQAARSRFMGRRIWAVFQPHTYTRTKALLDGFAAAFDLADQVALLEIFPARETDTLGVSSADILAKMDRTSKIMRPLTLETAPAALLDLLKPGDVLLTMGAGDVWKVGEEVLTRLQSKEAQP